MGIYDSSFEVEQNQTTLRYTSDKKSHIIDEGLNNFFPEIPDFI